MAWSVVLPWLLTCVILGVTAALVFVPRDVELKDPAKPGQTGALIWGDGVFANALELEAWLRVRGVSYREWARKHPAAVELLAPSPGGTKAAAPASTQKPAQKPAQKPTASIPAAKPVTTVAATVAAPAAEPAEPGWAERLRDATPALLLLGLLVPIGAVGIVVLSRLAGPGTGIDVRVGFVAAAASIGVGVAVASLVS